jgi:protoheme IX farnesyltransferase
MIGAAGLLYGTVAALTGASFVWLAWRLFRTREDVAMRRAGRALFLYSLSYRGVVFLALLTDHYATLVGWM